jgi:hypothetical protein
MKSLASQRLLNFTVQETINFECCYVTSEIIGKYASLEDAINAYRLRYQELITNRYSAEEIISAIHTNFSDDLDNPAEIDKWGKGVSIEMFDLHETALVRHHFSYSFAKKRFLKPDQPDIETQLTSGASEIG